jgi:hypothetical protein
MSLSTETTIQPAEMGITPKLLELFQKHHDKFCRVAELQLQLQQEEKKAHPGNLRKRKGRRELLDSRLRTLKVDLGLSLPPTAEELAAFEAYLAMVARKLGAQTPETDGDLSSLPE